MTLRRRRLELLEQAVDARRQPAAAQPNLTDEAWIVPGEGWATPEEWALLESTGFASSALEAIGKPWSRHLLRHHYVARTLLLHIIPEALRQGLEFGGKG